MSDTLSLVGYHLTFDAEFDNASDLSQFANSYPWGGTTLSANGELENYLPNNPSSANNPYSIANGALTITASPDGSGALPYTSGMLSTAATFSQNTGYFEIRAEMPAGSGFWPAFWMLPENAGYPEIDILEQPNLSGTDTDYWTHTSTPTNSSGGFNDTGVNVFSGYHTYGFLWTNNTIQYVFDGHLIGSPEATPPALAAEKMYLIANLAVGGWAGSPADGASSTISIDYIRAYSNDSSVPAVTPEAISSPDGANTTPVLTGPVVASTPAAGAPPVTLGTGPDALVLQIVEDAYQGVDAQFTVSVDGVQQGGVQTASDSNRALGQSQAFTINGSFGTSTHTVAVDFLNDGNGVDGDRNLYVLSATINGTAVLSSTLTELADGSQSFSFTGNVVPPTTPVVATQTVVLSTDTGVSSTTVAPVTTPTPVVAAVVNTSAPAVAITSATVTTTTTPAAVVAAVVTPITAATTATPQMAFITQDEAEIIRLYYTTLGRAPDLGGLGYWASNLDAGTMNINQVVAGFTGSAEFQSDYGTPNSQGFVDLLYQNVLGRAPDAAGELNWTNALNAGALTRSGVVLGFSDSAENVAKMNAFFNTLGIAVK